MTHGTVTIQPERCKGCELCVHACPQDVLRLSNVYNSHGYRTILLDETQNTCTGCGVCALVCPDVVFTVFREVSNRGQGARGR